MNTPKLPRFHCCWSLLLAVAALVCARPASAQTLAYDDATNYVISANWTNGANQGFGFTPWFIATNGPDFHGTYVPSGNNPPFVIASVGSLSGVNYNDVWGLFANGTNDINETVAFRGFASPLGTNTFKLQWGARGAGVTTTVNAGPVHGWCGFTLRSGNATNNTADFQTGVMLYVYFLDGAAPSTLYVWDGNGVQSVPGTSFSDLGRDGITNAIQAEVTPAADGQRYHLVLKDCVQGRTLYTLDSYFISQGTVDSVALFCHETTGDQVYNRMQIAVPHVPPSIVNVLPANGSLYLDASSTSLGFEVDSFNSTVSSSAVSVYLNGVAQGNLGFNTTDPTTQLFVTGNPSLVPNTFYTYSIIAQDANGNSTTNTGTFNTFLASNLYIDASDYNYNSGLFVNSPTPANSYAGYFGSNGVDYLETDLSGTNNLYRPGDLPQILSLDPVSGDPVDHAGERAGSYTVYNLGFTDIGEWQNYTRNLPSATNYSVYARAASTSGGQFEIEVLANATATGSNQPLAALGRVIVPNTGGSRTYTGQLQPLTDAYGNTVIMPLSGTRTLRCTAVASRVYNLEYLLVVPVTNATSTLRPYVAVASPAPNATGVGLASPVTFTLAHRQTTVNSSTIKLYTNSVLASTGVTISSNAAGCTVSFTPTVNMAPNSTNTIMVTYTDSASANLTNTWSFVTAASGGTPGSGLWSGGGGFDLNWSTAANWTGGTPGVGNTATFASPGATTTLVTNNIVSTNVTIGSLLYSTNNSGFHTTYIADGMTLTVSNNTTSVTAAVQVGADNIFNKQVTNTITGTKGTLMVLGNSQSSGLANQLNFQIRQCANPPVAEQNVLDMSGLGTLIATVGKFYVAQGGSGSYQSNVSARVSLARTNVITCLRPNAGQFEVGDSSGGAIELPGSTLNLGLTNALFVDTARFGKQKATNNLVRFNPAFTAIGTPAAFIRGTNGLSSRVTTWTVGDADAEATVPNFVSANVDFSGGKVDAMISSMILGRGETTTTDTGYALGTMSTAGGTLDVSSLQLGVQRAVNTATAAGTLNVLGSATLVCPSVVLAQATTGANASLVSGTLNITNGTARVSITAGGGVSTVNVNGGTLVVAGSAGTSAAPLSALNLANASLHLSVDGNATVALVNAAAVSATATTITVDAVANVAGPHTIHLIGYTTGSPFAGLALAPLPAGYTGTLVNNGGVIDLQINVSTTPPSPTIGHFSVSAGQFILSGTNNNHGVGGGSYHVLTSTNVSAPLTNWSVLTSGTFDANGNFSVTNPMTGSQRFYLLQVP